MKTPPILLKLLHNSTAKSRPNFPNTSSRKGDGGFTLLEVLIIVLILGIFASIAAPSWLGFINRQRVRTVNDRVLQTLRSAQSEAKRTKSDRVVTFNTPVTDPPTATIDTIPPNRNASGQLQPIQTVTFDGGGEIKSGTIRLVSNPPSITFDYLGNPSTAQFVVTVDPATSEPNSAARQCVRVQTLIGGMRTGEGSECDS
ncbi:transcriptional regulator [filamentous cyanobacterium Phorm 6]|nr:transcriptional regulator [filamentous cyanobacterium Phorm 6]